MTKPEKMTKAEIEAEAAYADWAYAHRDEFEKMAVEKLKRLAKMTKEERAAEERKEKQMMDAEIAASKLKQVTLRLRVGDIELAKKQCVAQGVPYQTWMKYLLHRALAAEQRRMDAEQRRMDADAAPPKARARKRA